MRGIAVLKKLLAGFALRAGFALAASVATPALADDIEVIDARLSAAEEGAILAADFSFELGPRLAEVVTNGVPLYFVVEFELNRPRWYWWDERVAAATRTYRLSYHALTQQYRVALNSYVQSFGSLPAALAAMSGVRGWRVIEPDQVKAGSEYEAQVRMRLDAAQLPKPFQVTAITNRDWTLQAEWKRFRFVP